MALRNSETPIVISQDGTQDWVKITIGAGVKSIQLIGILDAVFLFRKDSTNPPTGNMYANIIAHRETMINLNENQIIYFRRSLEGDLVLMPIKEV